jgi:hypothetical protein
MALGFFLLLIAVGCAYASVDWRRAWFFIPLCAVIQDPVRKLTPGVPVIISFAVVAIFGTIILRARRELIAGAYDFTRRFPRLYTASFIFFLMLIIAAFNGLFTYGIETWKVPLLSFATYIAPVLAVLFGFVWLQREEMLYRFLRWYSILTCFALIGTVLEYVRFNSRLVGMVGFQGDFIRYMPGIQIRLLSGFYRAPDIMAWHAATLTVVAAAMVLRTGIAKQAIPWSAAAAWGLFNCLIAGRRKAVYYILVFAAIFVWRYIRSIKSSQLFGMIAVAVVMGLVLRKMNSSEDTSVYAQTALASQQELAGRIEGGVMETFEQFGYLGAGLGTATQGVRHLIGTDVNIGWQEGGLGKLAMEVGLPGIIAIMLVTLVLSQLLLILTRIPDVDGSSQFVRVLLFSLVMANVANFVASAQAYTDAILALMTGFFAGCLFAAAALDERLAAARAKAPATPQQLTSPALA